MRSLALALLLCVGSVNAAVVGEVSNGTARIVLHDEAGPCVNGALLAVYESGEEKVLGCWKSDGQAVYLAFLDADSAAIPARAFRKPQAI